MTNKTEIPLSAIYLSFCDINDHLRSKTGNWIVSRKYHNLLIIWIWIQFLLFTTNVPRYNIIIITIMQCELLNVDLKLSKCCGMSPLIAFSTAVHRWERRTNKQNILFISLFINYKYIYIYILLKIGVLVTRNNH